MREKVVDSFAGGGGASEGIRMALGHGPDVAINHDAAALAMHRANHPETHHLVEDVWHVDPISTCDNAPIGLFWMSPDCKHFSKAKGGKPREKAIRGLAMVGLHWANRLPKWQRPRVVILENVEEFQDWGPLLDDGKPDPLRKSETFQQFNAGWRALGYKVEFREMRACDYGAPTIRKRLFWIARRDGKPIVWPERTHGNPKDARDAIEITAGRLKPWRTAAEIIDWSLPCPSIFDSSQTIKARYGIRAIRPLADNTMARVAKGTMRYVVNNPTPFIVKVNHTGRPGEARDRGIDEPIGAMTGHRDDALVTPFVAYAQQGGAVRDIAEPLHTLTASRKDQDTVVAPFVTKFNTGATGHGMDEPLATVTAHASDTHGGGAAPLGVVAPVIVNVANGQTTGRGPNAWPVEEPARTITAAASLAVVAPFLAPRYQEKDGQQPRTRAADEPVATIIAGDNVPGHLVTPFLVPRYGEREGQEPRTREIGEPMPVIVPTGNGASLVAPVLVGCGGRAGQSEPRPGDAPMGTQTAKADLCVAAVHISRQFGNSVGAGADEPVGTITAGGDGKAAVVAAFLAQHNTDMVGHEVEEPVSTIVGKGCTQGLVAAFLAQHNAERVDVKSGRPADEPVSTITASGGNQNLVAAHVLNLRGADRRDGPIDAPAPTATAQGNHAATVYAFLAKYYGEGLPSQEADEPLHTVTTKPRHGLVTVDVAGEPHVIVDIGMRMLTPRERFSAQGFRTDYIIDHGLDEHGARVPLTLEQQGRMCGNSVSPVMARALVGANYRPAKVRLRAIADAPLLEAAE